MKSFTAVFFALITVLAASAAEEKGGETLSPRVFPGAEGFGVTTPAGFGGRIIPVTTLEDGRSVPGSLRKAMDTGGPRVIIFEVAGTIELKSRLYIDKPYVSILGQTAPSPGITLKNFTVGVRTHDVVIQHLRIRIGDEQDAKEPSTMDGLQIVQKWPPSDDLDNTPVHDVVIDHCSISWAIDENLSVSRARDVTISNCIISEALRESRHRKGGHSMGVFATRVRRLALLNNLIAHCANRTPKLGSAESLVCNNVIYNPVWQFIEVENALNEAYPQKAAIIGNVTIPGADSKGTTKYAVWINRLGPHGGQVYLDDNPCAASDGDPWSCVKSDSTAYNARVDTPSVTCVPLTVRAHDDVVAWVTSRAGARPLDRDAVDRRIVEEVRSRTGRIIDTPKDVGGWPRLDPATRGLEPPRDPRQFWEWLRPYTIEVEGEQD